MSRYVKGDVALDVALSTLAAQDVVTSPFPNVDTQMRCSSIVAAWTLQGGTSAGTGQGPLIVGLAHGDYSTAEILEWFASNAGIQADMIQQEHANRKCRHVGDMWTQDSGAGAAGTAMGRLKNGSKIRTKMQWHLAEGADLAFWARNTDSAAVVNASTALTVTGTVYVVLV